MGKGLSFQRRETAFGVLEYVEQGVGGQGLIISGSGSGLLLRGSSAFLTTRQDLEQLAKAVAGAFKNYEILKSQRQEESSDPPSDLL